MKKISFLLLISSVTFISFAGNKDRAGEAGASELLVNPWARSTGWGSAGTAYAIGLEAMNLNVAGIAFTRKTELMFNNTQWLKGSGITFNSFGFTQRVGESGVMGLSVVSLNFGDIEITTTEQPEGGIGFFTPNFFNIALAYAKEFSNSIYGGLTVRTISESISNVSAQGVAFDAGIKYITGEYDRLKIGISLRNIGPPMKYSGDGLSFTGVIPETEVSLTVEQRSSRFEIPSLVNIGASYDFYFNPTVDTTGGKERTIADHKITIAGTFTSNAFTRDQFRFGVEYGFNSMFFVRAGYVYENGSIKDGSKDTALSGPSAGFSIDYPIGKNGAYASLDYSYRLTNPFAGTHSIGIRVSL